MFKSFFKKLFLILFLALLGGIAASFIFIADPLESEIAGAIGLGTPAKNVFGWVWSDNVGWISFNCVQSFCSDNRTLICNGDSDCVGDCEFDTVDCDATSNYGVNYNSATGNLSGYAWGDNIGWINFDSAGPFPESPNHSVQYSSVTGDVTGWARIVNKIDEGAGEGWIKFDGWNNDVTVSNNQFYGWAWNKDSGETGVGWISFNCANQSECGTSNYKVYINHPPAAENLSSEISGGCAGQLLSATLGWGFSDNDSASSESAYEVEVRDSGGGLVLDTGKVAFAAYQRIIGSGLAYNQNYDWQVRVWDNYNLASEWAEGNFTTPLHQAPDPDFTWGPSSGVQGTSFSPSALEDVFFAGSATTYGGATIAEWDWVFADALPNASTTPNPGPIQFQSAGDKEVTLTVTDSDGLNCDITQNITSQMSLPIWEEVKPE
ncbi:MAG: PKD domain-containing protein [Patescibacteria group bacterium]|jgi:hypothetical protein